MRILKTFLISLSLTAFSLNATACIFESPERWYMFCFCEGSFRSDYDREMNGFWEKYCGKEWFDSDDMMKAAQKKGDAAMQAYLRQLRKYTDVCSKMADEWDYPTATELANRKRDLRAVATACTTKHNTKYGERWLLLQMRANMLLKNYTANKQLWQTKAKNFKPTIYKDMMRNVYANALLNTGQKREAWNIYAEQNDAQSLLWSVRKFTNLAGIKKIYATDPNAPVMTFLLEQYVNQIQEVMDSYDDSDGNFSMQDYDNSESAYASLDVDYMREIKSFALFAQNVAKEGRTNNPCLWMSASALVSYFLKDYSHAKEKIDKAMTLSGTDAVKRMARRIRMLIATAAEDINSNSFKEFMVSELHWLDTEIQNNNYGREANARDRILNLGLAQQYLAAGKQELALALFSLRVFYNQRQWDSTVKSAEQWLVDDDHCTEVFDKLFALSAKEVEAYFKYTRNYYSDPLAQYAFKKVRYTDNYMNDLLGTKYLAESQFEKALTFLEKVPQAYLNKQAIAHYAYYRSYKIPAWYRYVKTGKAMQTYSLKGNQKVDFCRDMISLNKQYNEAQGSNRLKIAINLAANYYQASYKGQCWYLTSYFASSNSYYWNACHTKGDFVDKARALLAEAAKSADRNIKTEALFGLAGTAWDVWAEMTYDYDTNKWTYQPLRDSEHYAALQTLDSHLRTGTSIPQVISRCDVLKSFRSHR